MAAHGVDKSGQPRLFGLKPLSLLMPDDLTPDKTPALDAAAMTKVLDAYHEQNPGAPRFRFLQSKAGLHIVPTMARDVTGILTPTESLLDAKVSVPVASRTATEHLSALCHAVTLARGVPVDAFPGSGPGDVQPYLDRKSDRVSRAAPATPFRATWLDASFAANGYTLRGSITSMMPPPSDDDERPYMLFEWGAKDVVARDALIDLLDRSGTTLSWRLVCGPPDYGFCVLNMAPVSAPGMGIHGRTLFLDRCANCRPAPAQR
jgi:hypothetical protein